MNIGNNNQQRQNGAPHIVTPDITPNHTPL